MECAHCVDYRVADDAPADHTFIRVEWKPFPKGGVCSAKIMRNAFVPVGVQWTFFWPFMAV
jgi:hypothetical protein